MVSRIQTLSMTKAFKLESIQKRKNDRARGLFCCASFGDTPHIFYCTVKKIHDHSRKKTKN